MIKEYFEIKDNCRKSLLKYLTKAISIIPIMENPKILDVGCGTGVPTLMIAEKFNGKITAVDTDTKSIVVFREKIKELNLANRITLSNSSLFDIKVKNNQYDLILAEGLLNVVGFRKGFLKLTKLLKRKGFIIIHDEFQNKNDKIEFIKNNDYKILDSFVLDKQIWWNDYFKCLEKEISSNSNKELLKLFKSDLQEIKLFKLNPSQYMSVYYIIEKN
jgi:ubiquinone/menaquinone biosynthesis C-methylase UbiE